MKRASQLLLFALLPACGNGDNPGTGTTDGSVADLSGPVSEDLSRAPDLSTINVPGTQLIAGSFSVIGGTSDEQAVFYDNDTGDVVAVPVAGGAKVVAVKVADAAWVDGHVVFAGAALDSQTGIGEQWVWTPKGGAKMLAASSLIDATASDDGAWVAWTGNTAADGSSADIFVGKSDGSGATKVFTGAISDDNCYWDFRFLGQVLLVSHCDKGQTTATLHVVDPATGKPTLLASNLLPSFSADKAGTMALVIDADSKGQVVTVPGAKVTAIATMDDGLLLPDASAVFYLNGDTTYRFALPGGSPVKLSTGVAQLFNASGTGYDFSPDGKWLIVPDAVDQNTGTGKLFLLSTQTAGAPVSLVADTTGAVFGDGFTADSSQAVYFSMAGNGFGPMHAKAVSGAAAVDLGAGKAWEVYAAKGSTVAWNDSYVAGKGNEAGTADILVADASKAGAGTLLVPRADEEFALTAGKDKVLFTSRVAGKEGAWVIALP